MSDTNKMSDVEIEQQAEGGGTTTSPEDGGTTQGIAAGLLDEAKLPYVGGFVSGVILLIALTVGSLKDDKYYEYGIAIAVVAMFFSLVGFVLTHVNTVDSKILMVNNYFLFLWNFIGTCFMTFGSPFDETGNGYFAAWGLTIFAVMGLGVNLKEETNNMGSLMGNFASSIVVIVAIAAEGLKSYKADATYALIVACLSLVVVLFVAKMERNNGAQSILTFPVLALFAILWLVAAALVTFRGPFPTTGNGYFGSWSGALTMIFAAVAARMKE
jgi:hypothetical protein